MSMQNLPAENYYQDFLHAQNLYLGIDMNAILMQSIWIIRITLMITSS